MPNPPNTVGQAHLDLEEISEWIDRVRGVLNKLDPATKAIEVPAGRWEPTATAVPAPIASPKCLRPLTGTKATTSIADLMETLKYLRKWTKDLAGVL
jgi:hypothetical protein